LLIKDIICLVCSAILPLLDVFPSLILHIYRRIDLIYAGLVIGDGWDKGRGWRS